MPVASKELKSTVMTNGTRLNIRTVFTILSALWLIFISAFLAWGIRNQKKAVVEYATIEANAGAVKDIIYRHWSAGHGGTYVPVTDSTRPNPYLTGIPDRDIVTPSGTRLTLVNPAYMTRQIHELGKKQYKTIGHITSLAPIRPENKPDRWEAEALQAFKAGQTKGIAVKTIDDEPYLRLMRPLICESSCLKCHDTQGYAVGDTIGGLSISVPLKPYQAIAQKHIRRLMLVHMLIGLLGLTGLTAGGWVMTRKEREKKLALKALMDSEERLKLLAHTDELTGVNNRRAFLNQARKELKRPHRYGGHLSALMIDIDHFKMVNDTYGHDAGDLVLISVAGILLGQLRENDHFGRLGGEEFAAILVQAGPKDAFKVAERMRRTLAQSKIPLNDIKLSVTVSIGISSFDVQTPDIESLLAKADKALYTAKSKGRNQVRL